ncbi:MAG: hypothetical protein ACMUEM_04015 [Flavobacteriales bacterium AspAUS03]
MVDRIKILQDLLGAYYTDDGRLADKNYQIIILLGIKQRFINNI